jgi:rare lipoprotein A
MKARLCSLYPGGLWLLAMGLVTATASGCAGREWASLSAMKSGPPKVLETKTGSAVYYSRSLNGSRTSSGGRVDNSKYTAAHHSYPFGTLLRVTRVRTGKSVEVRVTDHLPSTRTNRRLGIVIDLTRAAASDLDMLRDGRTKVKLEVLEWGTKRQR